MTVRIYPAPHTPGYVYISRQPQGCEVCANRELMVASRPGVVLGDIIRCPACTTTGARELARLLRLDGAG